MIGVVKISLRWFSRRRHAQVTTPTADRYTVSYDGCAQQWLNYYQIREAAAFRRQAASGKGGGGVDEKKLLVN